MPVNAIEFRNALSRFASGVTVVISKDAAGDLHGITVSAFSSVSLEPPFVLVCIEKTTGSHASLSETDHFSVNLLSSEQKHLSERFASWSGDKFDGLELTEGDNGLPLLSGCLANIECTKSHVIEAGDHSIFVGEVTNTHVADGDPLLYFRSDYRSMA